MRQPHKMVKHTQTICRQIADELFECVFDHFAGLELNGLKAGNYFCKKLDLKGS